VGGGRSWRPAEVDGPEHDCAELAVDGRAGLIVQRDTGLGRIGHRHREVDVAESDEVIAAKHQVAVTVVVGHRIRTEPLRHHIYTFHIG
jgi:hypothetical protein